jgi:hypothetical protein
MWQVPESRAGRLSVTLAALSLAGLVLLAVAFGTGAVEAGETFSDNWLVAGWGAAILLGGATAAVTGIVSVRRDHERSWMVLPAAVLGVLLTLVVLNEVVQGL